MVNQHWYQPWLERPTIQSLLVMPDPQDCESTTLATTIAFLYGVEVPPRFADSRGLLKMADMFFMEELREEAGRRLARVICERNLLELTVLAETHRSAALTAAAAKFIVNREGEVDVGVLEGLPRVTAAVAEAAMLVQIVTKP